MSVSEGGGGVCLQTEKCQFATEKCQFDTEKCQFDTEKCQLDTEKCAMSAGLSLRDGCSPSGNPAVDVSGLSGKGAPNNNLTRTQQ